MFRIKINHFNWGQTKGFDVGLAARRRQEAIRRVNLREADLVRRDFKVT